MPSASVKVEKQAPPETALLDSTGTLTPLRQAITIIEHKIRNLEKRKSKLESYKELQNSGKELNADQKSAVAKYGEVSQTLEFARDLSKQFMGIVVVSEKDAKRLAKKEVAARSASELVKVREVLLVQDALNQMGQESVRTDFLSGSNGAVTLAQSDLELLDELYPAVTPKHDAGDVSAFTARVQCAAEHLIAVVEGKQKEAFLGYSYTQIKEVIGKVHESGYLDTEIAVSGSVTVDDTDGVAPAVQEPEDDVATPVVPSFGMDAQESKVVMECAEQQSLVAEVSHQMAPQQQLGGAPSHQVPQQQAPTVASDHSGTGFNQGSVTLSQTQPVVSQQPVLGHEINTSPAVLPHHQHHHHHQQQPQSHHQQQTSLLPHQQQQNVLPPMQQQAVIETQQIMQQQQGALSSQQPLYYQQPPPPRNINEMLGPGSFFFLQDSEIDNPVISGAGDQLSSLNAQTFTNQTYTLSPHPQPTQPPRQISMQQPLSQQQQVVPPPQVVINNMQTMYNAHQQHQPPLQSQQALPQLQTTQHHQQPQQVLHSGIQRSSVSPAHSNVTKHAYDNSNNTSNNDAIKNGATNNMSNVDDSIMVEKHQRSVAGSVGGGGGGGASGHRGPSRINNSHHHQTHHQTQQQHQPFYANNNGYSNRNNRSSGSSGPSRPSRPQHNQ